MAASTSALHKSHDEATCGRGALPMSEATQRAASPAVIVLGRFAHLPHPSTVIESIGRVKSRPLISSHLWPYSAQLIQSSVSYSSSPQSSGAKTRRRPP